MAVRREYEIGDKVALCMPNARAIEGIIYGYTTKHGVCILAPGVKSIGELIEYRIVCRVKTNDGLDDQWYCHSDVASYSILRKLDPPSLEELLTHSHEDVRVLGAYMKKRVLHQERLAKYHAKYPT